MDTMKQQIADYVRKIDNLNREIAEHWSKAQRLVTASKLDEAITVLNAYFRLKTSLEQAESQLLGVLKGYFADK